MVAQTICYTVTGQTPVISIFSLWITTLLVCGFMWIIEHNYTFMFKQDTSQTSQTSPTTPTTKTTDAVIVIESPMPPQPPPQPQPRQYPRYKPPDLRHNFNAMNAFKVQTDNEI